MDKLFLSPLIPRNIYEKLSRYKCNDGYIKKNINYDSDITNISTNNSKLIKIYNSLTKKSIDKIKEDYDIINYIINGEYIPSIYILYYKFNEYFYTKLVKNIFNNIIRFFKKNKEEMAMNVNYSCGFILKQLEKLDPYIINFTIKKNYSTVIFEIHTSQFIKAEQHTIIENILTEKTYVSHEILMGKGKTSIITPYLILYNNNKIDNKYNLYHIILPNHLVQSSYTIINKINELFNKLIITTNDLSIYKEDKQLIYIIIHGENEIKKYILKLRMQKNFGNINITKLFNNSLCIFDEIDNMINPLKSNLNIPIEPFTIHPYNDIIIELIIIIGNILSKNIQTHGIEDLYNITISSKDTHINILSNDINIDKNIDIDKDIIHTIVKKLNFIINKYKMMIYNRHYGFASKVKGFNTTTKNYFIAIPYNGNHNPVNESEFSDFELSLLLTVMSYFNRGKIIIDDIYLLLYYINKYNYKKNTNNKIYVDILYSRLIEIIGKEIFYSSLDLYGEPLNNNNIKKILDTINNSSIDIRHEFISIYVANIIFKLYFTIPKIQYNISTVDLLGKEISKNKICFSGTVNYNTLKELNGDISSNDTKIAQKSCQLYDIKKDIDGMEFIKVAIMGILYEPKIYTYDEYNKEEQLLNFIKKNINTYNALIDTCGIIINKTPIEVIEFLYKIDKTRTYLYIDMNGIRMKYTPLKSIPYNNELYNNLFIYYDNKNCVGIDFVQPYTMKGLITVNQSNNLTEISQGIFRLRNINIGHSVDFYISDMIDIVSKANMSRDKKQIILINLYNRLVENDNIHKNNCKELIILQYIKYYNRMNELHIIKSYEELIYYETLPFELETVEEETSDEEYVNYYSNMITKELLTYTEFINKIIIDNINKKLKTYKYKNIKVSENILLKTTATNIAILTNIVTIENQTNYTNTFKLELYNLYGTYNIEEYFIMLRDKHLFTYNTHDDKTLLTIGKILLCISSQQIMYYNLKLDLYFVIEKYNDNIYIYIITFFEYIILDMSIKNKLFTKNINIYDKYGKNIYNNFIYEIPIYITILLFKTTQSISDIIESIYILYKITENTKDIIDLCKNIINDNININPCPNYYFNNLNQIELLDVEFWSTLLNITINKNNTIMIDNFHSIIQKSLFNILQQADSKYVFYNKYLKYKMKYKNLCINLKE